MPKCSPKALKLKNDEIWENVRSRTPGREVKSVSRYLIDTNILSEPLNPEPNPKVIAKMQRHTDQIAIAAIVWHEIRFGCDLLPPSRRRKHIEAYLRNVHSYFSHSAL